MAEKSETELLAEVLRPSPSGLAGRVMRTGLSLLTVLAVGVLFFASWRQVQEIESRQRLAGLEAHVRQIELQSIVNSARLSQAISAEFATTPNALADPASCGAALADRVVQGRSGLGWQEMDCMRRASREALSAADVAYVEAAREIFMLERFVVPLDNAAATVKGHASFLAAERRVAELEAAGDPRAPLAAARLQAAVLNAVGASAGNVDSQEACQALLASSVTPERSLEAFAWQAECLRKFEPNGAEALARFEAAAVALGGPPAPIGRGAYCASRPDMGRTEATLAARIYNGLGMTLVVRNGDLGVAEAAIHEAVCFRRKAQQTAAQIASSEENLAIIAYRRHRQGQGDLGRVRETAEAALKADPSLSWSWVLLYVAAQSGPDAGSAGAAILQRMTYLDPGEFVQPELNALLGPFAAPVAIPGGGLLGGEPATQASDSAELLAAVRARRERQFGDA